MMNRTLLLSALLLSAQALAQTQVWSDAPKTQTWSEPSRTDPAPAPPTTGRWSEPAQTAPSASPATPGGSAAHELPTPRPTSQHATEPTPPPPPRKLKKGDSVLVVFPPATIEYPGTVDRVRDGEYFIKFSGTIAPSDSWVPAPQVRPLSTPANTTPELPAFAKPGARVDVLFKGEWYGAKILEVSGGTAKVRYDRYDASWDEWVGPDRLRPSTKKATANPLPTGKFVCQVFEENQLKPQGELVLDPNGTYRDVWNKKSGSWKFDASTSELRFTGVLQNGAKATYDPDARHGMITFDWGNGVKRWCYR